MVCSLLGRHVDITNQQEETMQVIKDVSISNMTLYTALPKWSKLIPLFTIEASAGNAPFYRWDYYDLKDYENLDVLWVAKKPIVAFRQVLPLDDHDLTDEEIFEKYPDWIDEIQEIKPSFEHTYTYLKEVDTEDVRLLIRGLIPLRAEIEVSLLLTQQELYQFHEEPSSFLQEKIHAGKAGFTKETYSMDADVPKEEHNEITFK